MIPKPGRIVFATISIVAILLIYPFKRVVFRDDWIVVFEKERVGSLLFPHHSDPEKVGYVNNIRLTRLTGSEPFHLPVEGGPLILFVTQSRSGAKTIHLLNTNLVTMTDMNIGKHDFGTDIGFENFGRKEGMSLTESAVIKGQTMILTHTGWGWGEALILDLKKGVIVQTNFFEFEEPNTKRKIER